MKKKIGKLFLVGTLAFGGIIPLGINKANAQEITDYTIYPNPQMETYSGGSITVPDEISISYSQSIDNATKDYLGDTLSLLDSTISDKNADFKVIVAIKDDNDEVENEIDVTPATPDLYLQNDAYSLKVHDNQISILGNDNDAVFAGISTLKIMLEQTSNNQVLKVAVEDYSDVQYRGVVEGYYGIPWSNENVISYMEWGSKFKLNTFIYAPKDDPYHNSKWREEYPQPELNKMKDMIEAGTRTKVRFVYAIHPFMSNGINKNDFENELKHITDKFQQLYDLGVRQFALLADDASSETALQVKTINSLTDWLNSKEGTYPLIFCPQSYSGTPSSNYFSQFKNGTNIIINGQEENVPAVVNDVEIMYTGSAIIGNVESGVADTFNQVAGRNPYFWLNWPVNDYTDSTLFIGKAEMLKSRKNNLNGLVANPMCEAQLSKIGLFQVADYAWNIDDFDVDTSWKASFSNVDSDAAEALGEVAKHLSYPRDGVYHTTGLAWEESEELAPYIADLKAKIEANEDIESSALALKEQLQIILNASQEIMEKSKNQNLKEEYAPYKESLDATINAGIAGMDALIAYYQGNYDTTWQLYSTITNYIEASNSVTKPGLKPAGNVQLEVKPGTKRLRPLAGYLNQTIAKLMSDILDGNKSEPTTYYHFNDWIGDLSDEVAKYIDGDESTFTALEGYGKMQRVGDYFGIDLGKEKNISNISIVQGKTDSDLNIYHYGVLEVSSDGQEWSTIWDYTDGSGRNRYNQDVNLKARYVRMRLTKQGYNGKNDFWVHIRDFKVVTNDGAAVFSNLKDLSNVTLDTVDNTCELTLNSIILKKDDYVGIDLAKIMMFDINTLPTFTDLDVEVSKNGKEWQKVAQTDAIIARYIRIINKGNVHIDASEILKLTYNVIKPSSVSFGLAHGEIDAYNPTPLDNPAQELFKVTGLNDGEHTIVINSKGPLGQDKVSVDRFEIKHNGTVNQVNLTTTTEGLKLSVKDNSKSWQMWQPKANWLNTDELYLVDTTGTMEYTFTGSEIALFGAKASNMGELEYFIDGVAYDGSGDAIFDGKDSTQAHYYTNKVIVDLGQSIKLNNLKIKIGEESLNQNPELCLGKGKIEVSTNGKDYTTVEEFDIRSVSDLIHEVPYYYMNIDTDQQARYIALSLEDYKEFVVNELIVNNGEEMPAQRDYALSTTAPESSKNPLANLTDKDLSSVFTVSDEKSGYIKMDFSDIDNVSSITIVQDATTISGANVEIYSEGSWNKIGMLNKSINVFDVTDYSNVTAIRILYEAGSNFKLMEITYKTDSTLDPTVKYKIDFVVDDKVILSQRIEAGTILTTPESPSKEGYNFIGWFNNDKLYEFNQPVSNNLVLVAKFEKTGETTTNKLALQVTVESAKAVSEETLNRVVPAVVNEFRAALAEAELILADPSADQTTIDTSFYRLAHAIQMLDFIKGDKGQLEALIKSCENYAEANYTAESWAVLQNALTAANKVMEDENALEYEVTDALNDLNDA
ncbi:beta-N-acetylglucosaminidase domain-containing protein, partial [Thomasclavelia sp.]